MWSWKPNLIKLTCVVAAAATLGGFYAGIPWTIWVGLAILIPLFIFERLQVSPIPIVEGIAVIVVHYWIDDWWQAAYVGYAVVVLGGQLPGLFYHPTPAQIARTPIDRY